MEYGLNITQIYAVGVNFLFNSIILLHIMKHRGPLTSSAEAKTLPAGLQFKMQLRVFIYQDSSRPKVTTVHPKCTWLD